MHKTIKTQLTTMRKIKNIFLRHPKKDRVDIKDFEFDENKDPLKDIQDKYSFNGDLLDLFINNKGLVVHKWHHYIPIYEKYFSKFRNTKVRFLEIGVCKGGSIEMWRKYLGDEATIYGIDINEECRNFDGHSGSIRIGSQTDLSFLDGVIEEMQGVDIILDDGSHKMHDIETTLQNLFPKLSNGGLYVIEDLHTAYWQNWGGGINSKNNFFNTIRKL